MPAKNPSWTRSRAGRNRVHWVAYDDRPGSEDCQIVDQGYAKDLREADLAAKASLANAGHYQARRALTTIRPNVQAKSPRLTRPDPVRFERDREYLYTRKSGDDGVIFVAAHRVVKKTPRRVYVTRKSCGPDQVGTDDEHWDENEPTIALDRLKLERDGSVYTLGYRLSDFYRTRQLALGTATDKSASAFRSLGIAPPVSLDEIKSAYRRKALESHPDRGGNPGEFQAVEVAYRVLIREAQAVEA